MLSHLTGVMLEREWKFSIVFLIPNISSFFDPITKSTKRSLTAINNFTKKQRKIQDLELPYLMRKVPGFQDIGYKNIQKWLESMQMIQFARLPNPICAQ